MNHRPKALLSWGPQATHYHYFHTNSISLPIHEGFTLISLSRIASLVETGLVEHWKQVHYPKDNCAGEEDSLDNQRATVDQVSGIFIMLVVGLLLSSSVLVFEHYTLTQSFHHRWMKFRKWFFNVKVRYRSLIKPT